MAGAFLGSGLRSLDCGLLHLGSGLLGLALAHVGLRLLGHGVDLHVLGVGAVLNQGLGGDELLGLGGHRVDTEVDRGDERHAGLLVGPYDLAVLLLVHDDADTGVLRGGIAITHEGEDGLRIELLGGVVQSPVVEHAAVLAGRDDRELTLRLAFLVEDRLAVGAELVLPLDAERESEVFGGSAEKLLERVAVLDDGGLVMSGSGLLNAGLVDVLVLGHFVTDGNGNTQTEEVLVGEVLDGELGAGQADDPLQVGLFVHLGVVEGGLAVVTDGQDADGLEVLADILGLFAGLLVLALAGELLGGSEDEVLAGGLLKVVDLVHDVRVFLREFFGGLATELVEKMFHGLGLYGILEILNGGLGRHFGLHSSFNFFFWHNA